MSTELQGIGLTTVRMSKMKLRMRQRGLQPRSFKTEIARAPRPLFLVTEGLKSLSTSPMEPQCLTLWERDKPREALELVLWGMAPGEEEKEPRFKEAGKGKAKRSDMVQEAEVEFKVKDKVMQLAHLQETKEECLKTLNPTGIQMIQIKPKMFLKIARIQIKAKILLHQIRLRHKIKGLRPMRLFHQKMKFMPKMRTGWRMKLGNQKFVSLKQSLK